MGNDAYWILGMGGVGIAVGLFVYGKKITYAIGEKLVKITPSRGVAIELSSALVIITGSRLKIPLSTTHCQVGATVGVGLLENSKDCSGINCRVFAKTAFCRSSIMVSSAQLSQRPLTICTCSSASAYRSECDN